MSKSSSIEQAIHYIKSKWKEGKSLKEIAEWYRVDSGNLDRAFRNREGMTVKQFVDKKRKAYLVSGLTKAHARGNEFGAELGFPNDLAFYRWVKRAFGVSFTKLRLRFPHVDAPPAKR